MKTNFLKIFGLTCLVLNNPLNCLPAHALEREIRVTGSCHRQVTTDRGAVVVTAEVQKDHLKDAVKKATDEYNRVLAAVKKLQLPNADLRTVEYDVNEVREWEKNKMVFKGFRARIGLKVSTSDVQRLGEVTEIATREDMHEAGSLSTYLSDEKIRKEQDLCLEEAARHAQKKAAKLAAALGAGLGPIININENNVSTPQPIIPLMRSAMLNAASDGARVASPKIQSGRQEVTATIDATFQLKSR